MTRPARPAAQTRFRLNRVLADWNEATEMVRQASSAPDYAGPDPDEMERIGKDIARMREQLRPWIWTVAEKEARQSSKRGNARLRRDLAAIEAQAGGSSPGKV